MKDGSERVAYDVVWKSLEEYSRMFPNLNFSKDHVKAYYRLLKSLSHDAFVAAMKDSISAQEPFMRSAGQIYQAGLKYHRKVCGVPDPDEAWNRSCIEIAGGRLIWRPVSELADKAFRAVSNPDALWRLNSNELNFLIRDFQKEYLERINLEEQRALSSGENPYKAALPEGSGRKALTA